MTRERDVDELRRCRACRLPGAPENFRELEDFMEHSPVYAPEKRAAPAVYLQRVETCLACRDRMGTTCGQCGCYIPLRCALPKNRCPMKRW
ncbi:MAG: DUF6171 family protein [Christensenellales bacterium]|jgi:hypothetical protein